MKKWNDIVAGDKVMALAYVDDTQTVVYGEVVSVDDEFNEHCLMIYWLQSDKGKHNPRLFGQAFSDHIHCYESEQEKLAILLKIISREMC